ncbi:L,D-transpeptidase [Tianweitania sediminis]|uniref:L,D-transpeptidase n=1 Tax=Tianweitania sediminis TaxID=1502156 RepID=A0A8J7R7Q8_9HYPH|nr:L,D-transpeptidase [Tianweitania sediminis]MBP0439692.1 L,D-transpeptidase [Tianweitania sediminis]
MLKVVAGLCVLAPVLFAPVAANAAALVAHVDIGKQTMTVTQQGKLLYTWPVSTARPGFATPSGSWRPYRIHTMWKSRKYDDAPMPYAVFYHQGWAVHGTSAVHRLGQPASHGCVRLATSNAKTFYDLVKEIGAGNTRIIVKD